MQFVSIHESDIKQFCKAYIELTGLHLEHWCDSKPNRRWGKIIDLSEEDLMLLKLKCNIELF